MPNKPLKHSRQRDALLLMLKSTTSHPSAEKLYSDLKNEIPNISLATVYRNLNQLLSSGQIINMNIGGIEHYDANCERHYHLVCRSCNSIEDIFLPELSELNGYAEKHCGVDIDNHSLIFYGVCSKCKK